MLVSTFEAGNGLFSGARCLPVLLIEILTKYLRVVSEFHSNL